MTDHDGAEAPPGAANGVQAELEARRWLAARRALAEEAEAAAVRAEVEAEAAEAERRAGQVRALQEAQERAQVAVEQAGGHAVELARLAEQVAVNVRAMQGLKGELDRGVAFEALWRCAAMPPSAARLPGATRAASLLSRHPEPFARGGAGGAALAREGVDLPGKMSFQRGSRTLSLTLMRLSPASCRISTLKAEPVPAVSIRQPGPGGAPFAAWLWRPPAGPTRSRGRSRGRRSPPRSPG